MENYSIHSSMHDWSWIVNEIESSNLFTTDRLVIKSINVGNTKFSVGIFGLRVIWNLSLPDLKSYFKLVLDFS